MTNTKIMKLIIPLLVLSLSFFSFNAYSQCNGAIFEEQNGIVIMEAETITTSGWTKRSDGSASGGSYLAYTGSNSFNTPGVSTLTYKVKINSPGTYRFIWRNKIGVIANTAPNTEHNDSWLKINASDFYAQRGSSRIYPSGSGKTPNPNGASSGGWFKVYTNTIDWSWSTSTSDNDPHVIYATFNSAGVYDVLVSGRSNGHWIDRLVLYKEGSYTASQAQSLSRAETRCDGSVPPPTNTAVINSLQLFNANSDVAIGTLSNGLVINLAQTGNVPLTVVANTTGSSVQFQLSGPISTSRNEGAAPYALFGNSGTDYFGSLFPVGSYTLKATPTSSAGTGTTVTINFSVTNSTPPPTDSTLITSLQLFNSDTDTSLGTLSNGLVINLAETNDAPLAVVANTSNSVSSVRFQLSGPISISRNEGAAPFALFGNSGSDYFGSLFPVGSYTLTATPSTSAGTGTAVTVNFSVVDNTPPPTSESFSFVLVNSQTDQDISRLTNGGNVSNGSNINIRAVSPFGNTASVYLVLQGPTSQTATENVAPYALFGDIGGNYNTAFLANGSYTLTATAYSGNNRSGTNLGSTTIKFTVGASSAKSAKVEAFAYPNPMKDSKVFVKLPEKEYGTVNYSLKNPSGIEIETGKTKLTDEDKVDVNMSSFDRMAPGIYYLTVQSLNGTFTIPLIKK